MKKLISLFIILCMVMHGVPCLAEEYEYLAKETISNQEDIVEMSVEALSIYEEDSARYDFTTDDTEKIKAVLDVVNECRYFETKGVLMGESPTFLITFKYSDGKEILETFRESTIRIDGKKYQLVEDDYWKLEECIKTVKTEISEDDKKEFSDVSKESEYHEAISMLSFMGVMKGYDDNNFKPESTLTRAEAAAIIVRLLNLEEDAKQEKTNYTDVETEHWASGYINVAEENGIINGQGDGTFAPEEHLTYNQLLKMLVCTLGYEPLALASGGWNHGGYVFAAKQIGLIESEPESIDEPITRGEAAEAVYKSLDVDFMERAESPTGIMGQMYEICEGVTILTGYWDYNKIECEVREANKNEVKVVVTQNLSNKTNFVTGQYVSFNTNEDLSDLTGEKITAYVTNSKLGANYMLFTIEN